jgi:oligoribonuclease NrnB/cAMP/cGMP phosphodiesterase (DHH superfamily)
MDEIVARAASVVVLDHHDGVREVVEAMPEFVFDNDRSGATVAWGYFHPGLPVPFFLKLLEDQDLYRHELPETVPLHCYLEVHPFSFELWDELVRTFEDPRTREVFLEKARAYAEYFELLADMAVRKAKLVSFEGHEVYFANCHPFKSLKSRVGNALARKHGPFSLVVAAHPNGYGVSIRGDGSVSVANIAQKYGGNGHPNSSGFLIPRGGPFPWELLPETDEKK